MSDHFSGPRALTWPALDLTDLYVFPSPEQSAHLVLVMDICPSVGQSAFFSDAITYRFRLRPITIAATGPAAAFDVGESEWTLECTFEAPEAREGSAALTQRGRCTASTGDAVSFVVNDEQGGRASGLRAFAGVRSDPFFIDLRGLRDTVTTRQLALADPGTNSLSGDNVLSIVVEIESARFLGTDGSLLALVCEIRTSSQPYVVLERLGRPEVKNFMLSRKDFDTVNRDIELRDLYNNEDAFHLAQDYLGAYRARLNATLAFFDGLDGKTDWPLDARGAHPLSELLLADFLVVDPSKPFVEQSTFEIEQAMLAGRAHSTCGGRPLNDDVVDKLLTWLVNGGNGPPIRDGVDQATVRASNTFPYLAPPNPPEATAYPILQKQRLTNNDWDK